MALQNRRKRAASQAAGAARKKRAGPVANKCAVIAPAIRDAASLPLPVRKMISDKLVHVFGTYKEERHPFQVAISEMVGATLNTAQRKLEANISEAQGKHTDADSALGASTAANDAAHAACETASQATVDSKKSYRHCHQSLKDAKSALHDLETAAKTAESNNLATTAKKEKLESLMREFFTPVKEGTLAKGLSLSSAHAGKFLSKNFGSRIEREFVVCVVRTFAKAASSWRSFDHIVDKELGALLTHIVVDLASELEGMAAGKAARLQNIEAATAAVAAAVEQEKAAVVAHTDTSNAAKEVKAAARVTATTAKQQSQRVERTAASVHSAQHALTSFKEGPLAAYTQVEAYVKPPPAPEPQRAEEPAPVVEDAAPAVQVSQSPRKA